MTLPKILNFDCDGTWIDLYGVSGWLYDLEHQNVRPYLEAKPLINLSLFARILNKLQKQGYEINIISWTAKNSDEFYHTAVKQAKMKWLKQHIPSVSWNHIFIVHYGTPKHSLSSGYLFDDESTNRIAWGEGAFDEKDLLTILRKFLL